MNRAALVLGAFFALVACHGPAKRPTGELAGLAARFETLLEQEAAGHDEKALAGALAFAKDIADVQDPAGADAAYALDAFLTESMSPGGLRYAGLVHRQGKLEDTARSLEAAAKRGSSPGARPVLARLATQLYEEAGLGNDADRTRRATGCVQAATVSAPDSYRHEAIRSGTELSKPGAAWPGRTKSVFGALEPDAVTRGLGCTLVATTASAAVGTRSIAVDVITDGASEVFVHVTGSAFAVHLGGSRILSVRAGAQREQGHSLAGAAVTGDRVRLVVRTVADEESNTLTVHVVDGDGAPLQTRPVAAGSQADGRVTRVLPGTTWQPQNTTTPVERAFAAHGLVARGHPKEASALVHDQPGGAAAHAQVLALESATDLADSDRLDRQREALERLLVAWPNAWEAKLLLANNAGRRRGEAERAIASFRALGTAWETSDAHPGLRAAAWTLARQARLFDVARPMEALLPSTTTPFAREIRLAQRELPVVELAKEACGASRPAATDARCHAALAASGKTREALAELERIAVLRGAPRADLHARLRLALALGDSAKVAALVRDLAPGERTLAILFLSQADGRLPSQAALFDAAVRSEDAIVSLPALAPRTSAPEFVRDFDEKGRAAVDKDRKSPASADAPTLVLDHAERYVVEAGGLLHYWIGDVRRLSGTADVESNADARRPSVYGQVTSSVRLRRILKRDGRTLLPDPTPMASQAHADLSQLEAGDYVLSVYEGFALPGPTWNLGFDSPDLLPERTAVEEASLELRYPVGLAAQMALHPSWGKATETTQGNTRTLTAHVAHAKVRKIGDHLPRSERTVHVSFSTITWRELAQAMGDESARITAPDAEVSRFAAQALAKSKQGAPHSQKKLSSVAHNVDVLVRAVGERVTHAIGSNLADFSVSSAYGMTNETARSILTVREGSRSLVLRAALQSVGIQSEVVVAEQEPWSNGESYPPHPGRFVHPLLLVPPQGDSKAPIWIDADVPGAPLPAGRVSPELHGRLAVHLPGGAIEKLPETAFQVGEDEVDIRMALDGSGNAKGEITILLRGHLAQELSAAFERVVGQERDRILRSLVSAWVAGATVDEAAYSDQNGVAVRARFTAGAYAERLNTAVSANPKAPAPGSRDKKVTFIVPGHVALHFDSGGERSTLLERYGDSLAREGTLSVRDAVRYHVRRSIDLPPGFTLGRGPGPLHVESPGLRAERSFQVGAGKGGVTLVDDVRLSLETQTIEGARVSAFVETLRKVDEGLLASERIGN